MSNRKPIAKPSPPVKVQAPKKVAAPRPSPAKQPAKAVSPMVGNPIDSRVEPNKVVSTKNAKNPGARTAYWKTLNAPESVHGVKVPDTSFQESGTYTTVQRFTQVVPSSAYTCGFFLGNAETTVVTPLIFSIEASNMGNDGGGLYAIGGMTGATAITTAPFSYAGTTAGISPIGMSTAATIADNARKMRLVSMSVETLNTAAPLNQSGVFYAAVLPGGTHNEDNKWSSESVATLSAAYDVQAIQASKGGVRMLYTPTDNTSFEYCDSQLTSTEGGYNFQAHDPCEFFLLASGLAENTVLMTTITMNWEFIPYTNALQMGVSPSYVDYMSMEYALNHVAEIEDVVEPSNIDVHQALSGAGTVAVTRFPDGLLAQHTTAISRLKGGQLKGGNFTPGPEYKPIQQEKSLMERFGAVLVTVAEKVAPWLLSLIL